MAAGDRLLDADGNRMLDSAGNVMLDDGAGNDCCCGRPATCCGAGVHRWNQWYGTFADVDLCLETCLPSNGTVARSAYLSGPGTLAGSYACAYLDTVFVPLGGYFCRYRYASEGPWSVDVYQGVYPEGTLCDPGTYVRTDAYFIVVITVGATSIRVLAGVAESPTDTAPTWIFFDAETALTACDDTHAVANAWAGHECHIANPSIGVFENVFGVTGCAALAAASAPAAPTC